MPVGLGKIAAVGMFDGVHCGHRALLADLSAEAARRGLEPMAVTFSRHPLEVVNPAMAPSMLTSEDERLALLAGCFDGEVVVLDFNADLRRLTAREFMMLLRDRYDVAVVYMGFNHRFGSDRLAEIGQYRAVARELGMDVVQGCESEAQCGKVSSSRVRHMLERGDVESAAVALGREYAIAGTVVHGKRLGRELGFPTANIVSCDKRKLVPLSGVYVCRVVMPDGLRYGAMVNIGYRPTVDRAGAMSIEAHMFDFNGDIYGKDITLEFVSRLRDERCFGSVAELKRQLQSDAMEARTRLQEIV